MNDFSQELHRRLALIRQDGLYRELRRVDSPQSPRIEMGGQVLLNFSSNDYLGLANDPLLKQAAMKAIERFGAGSGASRLICGSLAPHEELECALADFKGTEAALTFSSGYAAALGAITALMDKDDVAVIDKRVHACIVDAARLSGATLRVFAHNDLNDLERKLAWANRRTSPNACPHPRILVVTESVFSMDGDFAPLREIVELKQKHGAWLMVDEAHATGLFGARRRGWSEECGVGDAVEVHLGTLSKAIGSAGGFICGSRALIDFLVNRARSFIFSTAPPPALAAAARAAIRLIQSPEGAERCRQLWARVDQLRTGMPECGGRPPAMGEAQPQQAGSAEPGVGTSRGVASEIRNQPTHRSAIIPIMIGDEQAAVGTSAALRTGGLFVPAIRYPTVARGAARLRVTVSAAHTADDAARLIAALKDLDFKFQIENQISKS